MGNLADDTALEEVGDGHYRASLSAEWEIWGPMGGYVAATALRAVGRASRFDRPASFACHYLGVAQFDAVDLEVTALRSARTAESHRVAVSQQGRPILDAVVWSIGDVEGLEHDLTDAPMVPGPDLLRPEEELRTSTEGRPGYPFWDNFDTRPLSFHEEWPPPEPMPPVWRRWCRFRPVSTFDDPWLDACRSLILVDIQSWPAASGPHVTGEQRFIAPMLDLYVAFNDPRPSSQWLLADGHGPLARDGLMAWDGRLWSEDGHLVASGTGQMLCRRLPAP
jgi:acyl-CoA thioesterase-2